MYELGVEQYISSAYYPESHGALEGFHQTLKNMIRTYCLDFEKDWYGVFTCYCLMQGKQFRKD